MASVEELAAADPSTELTELARLAHEHPELRAAVAANPSTYEGLVNWLAQFGDPAIDAALARRRGVEAPVAVAHTPAATVAPALASPPDAAWHEPTKDLVLRWGTYRLRYGIGLGALVAAQALAFPSLGPFISFGWYYSTADVTNVPLLAAAIVLSFAGVAAMPSTTARRLVAAPIAVLGALAAQMYFLSGLTFISALAAWLILRQRGGLSYLLLIVAPLIGVVQVVGLTSSILGVALHTVGLVGVAWLARLIDQRTAPARVRRAVIRDSQRTQHQTAYLQPLYATVQPGLSQPVYIRAGAPTNTIAILALVFGIGGGLLGIILGHTARSQIRRTGEGGWGLATAGMVLGYVGLGGAVILGIGYAILILGFSF